MELVSTERGRRTKEGAAIEFLYAENESMNNKLRPLWNVIECKDAKF